MSKRDADQPSRREPLPPPTLAPSEPEEAPRSSGKDVPTLPLADRWRAAVETVRAATARHAKSLAYGRLVALRPGEVALAFPPDAAFHRAMAFGSARAVIEQALSTHFGRPTRLVEEKLEAAAAPVSLAEEEAQSRAVRARDVDDKVRQHPAVLSALRILGGEVEHVRVLDREDGPPPDGDP